MDTGGSGALLSRTIDTRTPRPDFTMSGPPPPPYETNNGMAMPPMLPKPPPEVVKYSENSKNAKAVDPEAARDALVAYINSTCCWGSDPAKKAEIETELWSSVVCQLETFIEYRVAGWEEKPYRNEHYTALGSGYAPQPWELQAQPIPHFQPSTEVLEVPFTSTIQECHECNGRRKIRCTNCGGDGKIRCNHCGGDGRVTRHEDGEARQERCDDCGGDGKKKCRYRDCDGDGRVTCPSCDGAGQMRKFAVITRTHEVLNNTSVVDSIPDSELSPDLISAAQGIEILRAQAMNIAPPQGFSPDLDNALVQLDITATNQTIGKNGYLHQERLVIKAVPVSKATARVDDARFHYWVYGTDNRCHIKEEWGYPAQMCCGCTLS